MSASALAIYRHPRSDPADFGLCISRFDAARASRRTRFPPLNDFRALFRQKCCPAIAPFLIRLFRVESNPCALQGRVSHAETETRCSRNIAGELESSRLSFHWVPLVSKLRQTCI